MKLYQIEESDVLTIVNNSIDLSISPQKRVIFIDKKSATKYGYPLKMVATIENSNVTIITVYPLKKGLKE